MQKVKEKIKDWETEELKNIASVKYGKATKQDGGNIPVVGSSGVYGYTNSAFVEKPTIVVGRKGSAGAAYLFENPCWPSDTAFYLDINLEKINPKYLYNYLIFRKPSGQHSKTTLPSLTRGDLEALPVSFPSLPEQQKIVEVLDIVQGAVEMQDKLIEKTRELKRATMHKLFTEGTRGEKQKKTKIGKIPESWEIFQIEDCCTVKGGKRLPKGEGFAEKKTKHSYIRVVDMKNNTIDTSGLKFITDEIHQKIKNYTINSDDIYISIAGSIGVVGRVPNNLDGANLTENAAKISIEDKSKFIGEYLIYYLSSKFGQSQIDSFTAKTSQPKLALLRINQISIPAPDMWEQKEIARILQIIDEKIEIHKKKKERYEELFRSLLHKLMGGEIRVDKSKI